VEEPVERVGAPPATGVPPRRPGGHLPPKFSKCGIRVVKPHQGRVRQTLSRGAPVIETFAVPTTLFHIFIDLLTEPAALLLRLPIRRGRRPRNGYSRSIKRLKERGYGFIKGDDGKDCFFCFADLRGEMGWETLREEHPSGFLAPRIVGRRVTTQTRYCSLRCRKSAEREALAARRRAEERDRQQRTWDRWRLQGLAPDKTEFTRDEWQAAAIRAYWASAPNR
jgi:hypothetical protein